MEVDKHCSRNFSWELNGTSGCVRLGGRAGDNLVSLSTDEAIKRIVALLRSAGDELDRQVRELGTAAWGWGIWAKLCCKINTATTIDVPGAGKHSGKIKETATFNSWCVAVPGCSPGVG